MEENLIFLVIGVIYGIIVRLFMIRPERKRKEREERASLGLPEEIK